MGIIEAYNFKRRLLEDSSHPGMKMIYGHWRKVNANGKVEPQQPPQRQGSRPSYMPRTPLPDNTQLQQDGAQKPQQQQDQPGKQDQGGDTGELVSGMLADQVLSPEQRQKAQEVSKGLGISPKAFQAAAVLIGGAIALSKMKAVYGALRWGVKQIADRSPAIAARASAFSANISKNTDKARISATKVMDKVSSVRDDWRAGKPKALFKNMVSDIPTKIGAAAYDIPAAISGGSKKAKKSGLSALDKVKKGFQDRKKMAQPGVKIKGDYEWGQAQNPSDDYTGGPR